MTAPFIDWWRKQSPQNDLLVFFTMLAVTVLLLYFLIDILSPILVALCLAYLLDSPIEFLARRKVSRPISATLLVLLFIALFYLFASKVLPILGGQINQLLTTVPDILDHLKRAMEDIRTQFPELITEEQINDWGSRAKVAIPDLLVSLESFSTTQALELISLLIYLVLVPMVLFFAIKDKNEITTWLSRFLPKRNETLARIWTEFDRKVAGYIRGKLVEIAIMWFVSFIAFLLLGLPYAFLLSFLVGLSVVIPFVGIIIVTIPLAAVAYFHWGLAQEFWWLILVHVILQILDGNVLVPILFASAVDLHPVAIIIAILFFGSLWGLLGVFFAIPLAALIHEIINACFEVHSNSKSPPIKGV